MGKFKAKYHALLKELASPQIHENIKSFISNLYDQFGTGQNPSFKPEHREEFISLRSQCRALINQTRGFCDRAIPALEYALTQFKAPHLVDVKVLAEKLLSRVDPKQILEQCEQLENKIWILSDRIAMDEYYKTSKIMPFLCSGVGAALAIASLVGLLFMPVVLEIEIALSVAGSIVVNTEIPSVMLLSKGLTKIAAENDFKQCKEKITETRNFIFQMKMELSNVTQNHAKLEFQLDLEDVRDLQPIYENLLNNMQEIRAICSKQFPA